MYLFDFGVNILKVGKRKFLAFCLFSREHYLFTKTGKKIVYDLYNRIVNKKIANIEGTSKTGLKNKITKQFKISIANKTIRHLFLCFYENKFDLLHV